MKLSLELPGPERAVDVVVVGENSLDLVLVADRHPEANGKQELREVFELPGGEGATAAVALARLGWRAAYVGRVGDDRFAVAQRAAWLREGVNTDNVITVDGEASRMAVILVDRTTGGRSVLWRRSPRLAIQPSDVPEALLASARVLLVGSDDVRAMTWAARRAKAHGVRTVGDLERIHHETGDLLRELDVIVMAATFPPAFTGATDIETALRKVADLSGAALTCVTLGERGCLARVGSQTVHVPAIDIPAIDTTGAGDVFRAGLIARWLMSPAPAAVEDLLRYASVAAGLACRALGAQTGAPTAAEVAARLG